MVGCRVGEGILFVVSTDGWRCESPDFINKFTTTIIWTNTHSHEKFSMVPEVAALEYPRCMTLMSKIEGLYGWNYPTLIAVSNLDRKKLVQTIDSSRRRATRFEVCRTVRGTNQYLLLFHTIVKISFWLQINIIRLGREGSKQINFLFNQTVLLTPIVFYAIVKLESVPQKKKHTCRKMIFVILAYRILGHS